MNRRQLSFVIILNALISLVVAIAVVWVVEARRPDPEALAASSTPGGGVALDVPMAATLTPTPLPGAGGDAGAAGDAAGGGEAPATGAAQGGTSADSAADPAASGDSAGGAAAGTPAAGTEYVVQAGDSLSGIADRFGVSVATIVSANRLDNPDFVFSGQRLIIPSGDAPLPAATPTPIAASVNSGIRLANVESAGVAGAEAIDVGNDSDLAVNLQGWRLEREGGPSYTFGNLLLFPGSGLKLHSGAGTDSSVDVYWNQPGTVWATGAVARLINPQGTEVSRLTVP
jgi:LysM repeat protein